MSAGFRDFEFDLPVALLASLISTFDTMESARLVLSNVKDLPDAQGVYQLLHRDRVVYIGKTDSEAGLRRRLERHSWTIQHRRGLVPEEVAFRALRVFVFTAIDLETQLIRHYGGSKVSWNRSGFGSNDPGRQRDTTKIKAGGFDQQFPIDLEQEINLRLDDGATAAVILDALRRLVPYTVRAQGDPLNESKPHPDLAAKVKVRSGKTTALATLSTVVSHLPTGWQATLLPGRVILYREERTYTAGNSDRVLLS